MSKSGESSFDKIYSTDKKKAIEGIEVPVGINAKGNVIMLIVAELQNPNHEKAVARHEKLLRATKRSPEKNREVMASILSGSVLVGWSGVLDEKRKEIKFTVALGKEYLLKYPKLFSQVIEAADDEQNYQAELEAEDLDNLEK